LDVFDNLQLGTTLQLKAEPKNPFDPYAVAVYHGRTHLGYIPKEINETISKFLNMRYTDLFIAKISQINKEAHPQQQIRVQVRIANKSAK
jgi:hypothetical protein